MMRKETSLLALLSLFFLAIPALRCKKGDEQKPVQQPPAQPGTLKGKISNEYNQLLPGTVLNLQGNGANSAVTSTDGRYLFTSLQPGTYNIAVKKDGYIETSAAVSITSGDTLTKDIVLKAGTAYFNLL